MALSAEERETLGRFVHRTFGHDRFTQDSPIRPDTWLAYWDKIAEAGQNSKAKDRNPLVDVIITPRDGVEPGRIAVMLEWMLTSGGLAEITKFRRARLLAYSRSAVYVKLTFDELLKGVIPLTAWWNSVCDAMAAQAKQQGAIPGNRAELGLQFHDRVSSRVGTYSGDEQRTTTVDSVIQKEMAQFQLYRFGALASLTWHWQNTPKARTARMVELAHTLCERDTKIAAIVDLVEDFRSAMLAVDQGTRARKEVEDRIAQHAVDFKGVAEHLDRDKILIHSVSIVRNGQVAVTRSRQAVKGDAAQNVFRIDTSGIAWAVIDSGIDARHEAFMRKGGDTAHPPITRTRIKATYDFTHVRHLMATGTLPDTEDWQALTADARAKYKETLYRVQRRRNAGDPLDWALLAPLIEIPHVEALYHAPRNEHGTHVAGIIAADWPNAPTRTQNRNFDGIFGVCPDLTLYDLRVFNDEGKTDEDSIIHALEFIDYLNRKSPNQRLIHGVNISAAFGYRANAEACGQTQLCRSCNELVNSGVVVVAAAGNFGFTGDRDVVSLNHTYRDSSITDPGNADKVITVGSTHAERPHSYGVSYFSSRGPTADGRMKPDLVAPGEKIVSAIPGNGMKSLDGTSMAAPHVSGVAALLMARHRELVGQPDRVKEILCRTATSLGRIPAFQGAGMVDALRALQSV